MLLINLCFFLSLLSPEEEIRGVLDRQVGAWNKGDVNTFMDGYLNSDTLTFLGSSGIVRGWQPTMDRYKRVYSTTEKMGRLTFSELEFRTLGSDHALVLGKFSLERTDAGGGNASGRFSLVFQKTAQGWKIIHDHTS